MREILFRGKDIISGEWITGFLVDGNHIGCFVEANPIRPETVGQFTGLTDKNGKKIFEGDIVRFTWEHCVLSSPGGYFIYPSGTVFEVRCLESGYMLCKAGDNANYPNANGKVANYVFWNFHIGLEVVGNIYDNPELLDLGD